MYTVSRSTRGTGILPFLLSAEEGVIGVLVVRVGEIVIERSAGFMMGIERAAQLSRAVRG